MSSNATLNKEALEESHSRLVRQISDLLQQHLLVMGTKLEHLETKILDAGDRGIHRPSPRLPDTGMSLQPVAAGDESPIDLGFERQGSGDPPQIVKDKRGSRKGASLRLSLGLLPEEFASEASILSGISGTPGMSGNSGMSCGSSTSLTEHYMSRGEKPYKAASRHRDLEIMQGQLKMAKMRTSNRNSGHQDVVARRSNQRRDGASSAEDDMSESGEMPETREPQRRARPSRVSRVGRKSVHSEFGEAPVSRTTKTKKTIFAHAHDESKQLQEHARKLHQARTPEVESSAGSVGLADSCRNRLRRIVSSIAFEALAGFIIMTNSVIIGLEVEYMAVNRAYRSPAWFQTVHLLFAVEFSARLIAYGLEMYHDSDLFRWACLDFFIVVSSFVDLFLAWEMQNQEVDVGGTTSSGMSAIRVMRVLRISRLIRVTRIAKFMLWLKALRTLIHSILVTLKSLIWALVLLALIMYVFAIILSQAAIDRLVHLQDIPRPEWSTSDTALESFWGSMGDAASTLFMSITGGISWHVAETPLMGLSLAWKVVFMLYISFTMFAVLNVMTGVFCQSAIESAARDHDMAMQNVVTDKQNFTRKFRHLFHMLDVDDTGYITLVELEERMEDHDVKTYFEALELSIDDVWTFFRLLDGDSGQEIDLEEFLYGCMRLRGEAKALDLAKLMHSHAWLAKQQVDFMMFCEEKFIQLHYVLSEGASGAGRSSSMMGR